MGYPRFAVVPLVIGDDVGGVAVEQDAVARQQRLCFDPGTGRLAHLFDCHI